MSRIYDEVDSGYAEACSDVTVCSNKKGFFKDLANEVVSIAESTGFLNTFDEIDERSKVKAVMENETIMTTLQTVFSRIEPIYRGKDARVSYERRIAAQAALKENELPKALSLASQAVLRSTMTAGKIGFTSARGSFFSTVTALEKNIIEFFMKPLLGVDEVIDGGLTLALALWVRSEVLLKLEKPNAALEDLKLALKERLPAKMRAQYYWRMGHCYKGALEPTRAKVSYELAGRLLGNNEEAKIQLQKDIESLDHTPNKSATKSSGISLTGGAKMNKPALSKLVKITEEENKGRFVVANDQIKTGDVLLVDSPYAACLISDYYGSHCLHCFKRLEICDNGAPIWCPICSGVAFCSVECRDVAVTTYHPHECKFIDIFIGSGMSILSHIALRMITQAGLETSLQIYSSYVNNGIKTVEGTIVNDIEGSAKKSRIKSRKERLNRSRKYHKNFSDQNVNCEAKSVEDKESYQDKLEMTAAQIYSLCTHSTSRKGRDYLKRVVMAMFLTECLKRSGFFNKLDMESEIKAKTSICELIIHNLQLLQFNAHEIYETVRGQHQFSGSKPLYIAVGIYPTGALFNHECYPAVARYFEGKKIVLRAIRPLSPGATVSENYGPHFLVRSFKERRRSLACRYWFQCECVACREDWPTLKQMQSLTPYLRCPNTDCTSKFQANPKSLPSKCSKCSTVIDPKLIKMCMENIDECQTLYQEGAKLMDQENLDALSSLCKGVDLFHEVATPPHRDTHLAQESLRVCFAAAGNIYKVPEASI